MRARRTDANHNAIAEAFESLGWSVHRTNGDWDLTVGYGGLTTLVEVKDGKKSKSRRKLTLREQKFHDTWRGEILIVSSIEDVLAVHQAMLSLAEVGRK